jgi:hypothetical protein
MPRAWCRLGRVGTAPPEALSDGAVLFDVFDAARDGVVRCAGLDRNGGAEEVGVAEAIGRLDLVTPTFETVRSLDGEVRSALSLASRQCKTRQ